MSGRKLKSGINSNTWKWMRKAFWQRREQKGRAEVEWESWARRRGGGGGGTASRKHWVEKGKHSSVAVGSQVVGQWEDTGAWGQIHTALTICLSALGGVFACFAMTATFISVNSFFPNSFSFLESTHHQALSSPELYHLLLYKQPLKGQSHNGKQSLGDPHVATLTHFLDLFLNALTKSIKMQGTKEPSPLGDMCVCYNHYSYIHFIQSLSSSFMLGNVLEYKVSGFK